MNPSAPPRAERVTGVAVTIIAMVVSIVFTIWSKSLFNRIYGGAVFLLLLFAFLRLLLNSHKVSEAESIRRIDKAMGKPSDDPRQMARWVP